MNVTFRCPQCDRTSRVDLESEVQSFVCPLCEHAFAVPADVFSQGEILECLICPCKELYLRKDFSQRLGVLIIAIGIFASSVTWFYHMIYTTFGILFASALLDVGVYLFVGNLLQCYRCHAEYRSLVGIDDGKPFSLETHERHRQQVARLAQTGDN